MAVKKIKPIKNKAWQMFSLFIRQIYADSYGWVKCYTCDKTGPWQDFQAGHFVGGRGNNVLFNEECVRVQCVHCNIFLRGNYQSYTLRMIDEVGREKVEELLSLKDKPKKMNYEDFEEVYFNYRLLVEGGLCQYL